MLLMIWRNVPVGVVVALHSVSMNRSTVWQIAAQDLLA